MGIRTFPFSAWEKERYAKPRVEPAIKRSKVCDYCKDTPPSYAGEKCDKCGELKIGETFQVRCYKHAVAAQARGEWVEGPKEWDRYLADANSVNIANFAGFAEHCRLKREAGELPALEEDIAKCGH